MGKKESKKMQQTVVEGEQMNLLDVGPEHSEEIRIITEKWKAIIKERLVLQAQEAEQKAKLLVLIKAEKLNRLEDGSLRCRCEGWLIELKPTEEKLTATKTNS